MKKSLRLTLMSMLMLFAGQVFAEEVTINFDDDYATLFPTLLGTSSGSGATAVTDGDFTMTTTSTAVSGVTVTVSTADEGKTANRIWNTSPRLRMYSGTFTVSGTDITKIVFNAHSTNFNLADPNTGTLEGRTWTGEKTGEVTFTVSKNTQIKNIVVTLGEGGNPDPQPGTVTEVNVAQALDIIDGLANGAKTTVEYKVKGFVVTVTEISTQHGNATFTMADAKGGSPVLTFYRGKGFNGADITDENLLAVDDEVEVQGLLQKYEKNGEITPEVAQGGKIISINGNTGGGTSVDITKVSSIKAFVDLADKTVAELTLNNAIVNYKNVNGNNIELFISDGTGALDLYNMGITAEVGQVLSGTIIGTRGANSGFSSAMKVCEKTNVSTVTVGAAQTVSPVEIGPDEVNVDYVCQLVKIANATISEDGKKCTADGAELPLYDRFKLNLTNGLDIDKKYDIVGLIYDGGSTYGMELVVTAITLAGGGEIITDPATPVASIEALIALGETNNVELTLTNAKVIFNDGNSIYVRENGKALCFYQISGLKEVAKNNAIVNGKIILDYLLFHGMPEAKANKDTNLDGLSFEESEEEAAPVQTTLAAVNNGDHACDLVTVSGTLLREVTYKEDGVTVNTTTYYLQDGETKLVAVNNGKNLKKLADEADEAGETKTIIVTGVTYTTSSSNGFQIKLTKDAVNADAGIPVPGDVNDDGTVDVADISAIISQMAGTSTYEKADVNGDGTVDVADISNVITIMAGK